MNDYVLTLGTNPVQSKSWQYINTQPFQFNVQPYQSDMANPIDIVPQQKQEPEEAENISDLDKLMQRKFYQDQINEAIQSRQLPQQEIQTGFKPKEASNVSELPSDRSYKLQADESIDPNNPFMINGFDMGWTFDQEQGKRAVMHNRYMNGSYHLRGPGILDTTWDAYAKQTGDNSYLNWDNMNNAERTAAVQRLAKWYTTPLVKRYDISKLSQRQKNMIADLAWEYGQYSPMVKRAYAAFLSGDPKEFLKLGGTVHGFYNNPRNSQFKSWGDLRWDRRVKYLYG